MDLATVCDVFRTEAHALTTAASQLTAQEADQPTRCRPWTVHELLSHVRIVIAWLPGMLAAPEPATADVSATAYYRSDQRFAPASNATRIDLAQAHAAAHPTIAALVTDLEATWRQADTLCRNQPPHRRVTTRHQDAMLLSDFLLTRVVEVAVHGLDVADAASHEPWLTPPAASAVGHLLLGADWSRVGQDLSWDPVTLLRKVTGRATLTSTESTYIERHGIAWLALS
jgi:uncharacterized protein (TIGR03083 family)